MSTILLDRPARQSLACYLINFPKPECVSRAEWNALLAAEHCQVTYGLLGALCDFFGSEILDLIRWPKLHMEGQPKQVLPRRVKPYEQLAGLKKELA